MKSKVKTKVKTKMKRKSTIKSKQKQLLEQFNMDLDITDKSLIDFKKSKSISVASKISDLKSSKIGELYDVKPIHDNMHKLCLLKLQGKTDKTNISIPKKINKDICECLFEKNKSLSIAELEKRVLNRHDTPASECITILDNYIEKHGRKSSKTSSSTSRHKSSNTSRHKSSNTSRHKSRKQKHKRIK
jgi:hypothetical protein